MKDYLRHKIFNAINIKGLTALEYLDLEGKYREYREAHDFWELCYVKEGEIELELENKRNLIKEGQLFLIPPNAFHSYASHSVDSRAFVVCFESQSDVLDSISSVLFNLGDDHVYVLDKIIYESEHTFKTNDDDLLEVIASPNFGGKQAIILLLEYLLICLTRQLSFDEHSKLVLLRDNHFYSDFVKLIIAFLRENVRAKLTLNDICEKMNCSRSFACRVFKEQTGDTLFSYFNKLKIEEAKNMLLETDMSISDISYSLGFDELKYFDYIFKKHVGDTPNSYRKGK